MRILILLCPLILLLVGCDTLLSTPPGKGRKAEAGYRAAAPVIRALDKFHEDHGQYPAVLDELLPMYLPNAGALLVHGKVKPMYSPRADSSERQQEYSRIDRFIYRRDGNAYSLSFSYTGPGMNHCIYDSETRTWHSRGYY
ncbi:MAG: hypothetical protein JWQ71_3079 [Pedosphaera sp.]|nr:hypothetical protein [Pedosphaera sp.]